MKSVLKITIPFLFILLMSRGEAKDGYVQSTMTRMHDPVEVPGELLSGLYGKAIPSLRLFAAKDGQMRQVVYQIDERTPEGDFVMNLGEGRDSEGDGRLDGRDLLVFRVQDSGDKAPKSMWPGDNAVEIELVDPVDDGRSYCYLASFKAPPKRLDTRTVKLEHWDPWKRPDLPFIVTGHSYRIEGMVNEIRGKHYKTVVNEKFSMPESVGGSGENLLDGQRMRAWAELFFGSVRLDYDERSMLGGIDSLGQGPIRGFGRQWITVALPLGLEGPRVYSDVFTYDRVIVSPMHLNVPINPAAIITRAGLEFGYDMNENAVGMKFYSPNCMEGVTIDGKMSEIEENISDEWVPWYLITGPQGSLIFRVDIDERLLEQMDARLTYIDDLDFKNPPEDNPGAIGYTRTTIEVDSVKPARYDFSIEWYFPPDFYREGGYDEAALQEFLNIKDAPPPCRNSSTSRTPPWL